MSVRRDLDDVADIARAQGWKVEYTGGGHWRYTSPDGRKHFFPSTPSDHRALLNVKAHLRRAGLDIPNRRTKPKAR